MSDRRKLQVIQQQNVFGGQATVPHLEGDNATGLRIVAPSVEQQVEREILAKGGILAVEPSKEVEQPPKTRIHEHVAEWFDEKDGQWKAFEPEEREE